MSPSPQSNSASLSEDHAATGHSTLRRIWFGPQGLRAGWGALLFVVLVVVFYLILRRAERYFIPVIPEGPISFGLGFLDESILLFIVLLATAVMARIEGRRFVTYGYAGSHRLIRLASGIGWGILALSLLVGVLWKSGLLVFDGFMLGGFAAWKYALAWGVGFLCVGLLEESATRGYLQFTLTRGIGFWWAAVVLSLLFGATHVSNNGESHWGVAVVVLGGMLFCLSLLVHQVAVVGHRVPCRVGLGAIVLLWNSRQRSKDREASADFTPCGKSNLERRNGRAGRESADCADAALDRPGYVALVGGAAKTFAQVDFPFRPQKSS